MKEILLTPRVKWRSASRGGRTDMFYGYRCYFAVYRTLFRVPIRFRVLFSLRTPLPLASVDP